MSRHFLCTYMLFSIFRSSSDGVGGCKVSKTGWWWWHPFSEVRLRKCIYQIFHDVYLRYVFLFLEPAVVGWLGGWELCQQNWRSWTHSFYFFTLFVFDARIAFFFWQIFSHDTWLSVPLFYAVWISVTRKSNYQKCICATKKTCFGFDKFINFSVLKNSDLN